VLAAVEGLAVGVLIRHRVHRFDGVVAVNPGLGSGGPFQPVAVEECAVAEERADFPPVDFLDAVGEVLLDLCLARLHPETHLRLVLG